MCIRPLLAAMVLVTLPSGNAVACEPNFSTDPLDYARADTRLKQGPDCSFENESFSAREFGNPVRDRGNERIAQKLADDGGCFGSEELLFVDCSTGELVVLEGVGRPDGLNVGTFIEFIQKPIGPIGITSKSTVAELVETAEKHGIDYYTDFVARQKKEKRKNRYDAYCGCKLYYPDSVGAQMPKP